MALQSGWLAGRTPRPSAAATSEGDEALRTRQSLLTVLVSVLVLVSAGALAQSAAATEYDALSFANTHFCLNDPQGNTANGVQPNIWECNYGPNQRFTFAPTTIYGGPYLIELWNNPSKCLADPSNLHEDGIKLEIWECANAPAFQWYAFSFGYEFPEAEPLIFETSGHMAFGNKDGVEKNGNPVIMWSQNNGRDLTWTVHFGV